MNFENLIHDIFFLFKHSYVGYIGIYYIGYDNRFVTVMFLTIKLAHTTWLLH